MPNPTSGAAPQSPPTKLTAQAVIEMFADLGLLVSDDEGAIRQKIADQRDRRLVQKRSPDPRVSAEADKWFKNIDAMQNPTGRAQLVAAVYAQYRDLADTSRAHSQAAGNTVLTPALEDGLREIAVSSCKTDETLSKRFLEGYKGERQLTVGEVMVCAAPVLNFSATSGLGAITLAWKIPSRDFEEVEIVRELSAGRVKSETVYRGRGTSFNDTNAVPGCFYIYRAVSYCQGEKMKETPPTVKAVSMGEVLHAKPAWQDGAVNLTWQLPSPEASVLVFKKASGSAVVLLGKNGPEPGDAATTLLRRGNIATISDLEVAEGTTYDYFIVAEFGPGMWSTGVHAQVAIPKPPPAVASLTAIFQSHHGRNEVSVNWLGLSGGSVQYVVVRREGSSAITRPDDGTIVEETLQTGFLDSNVAAGHRYCYAVFARAGDLYSRSSASAPPVDILADVVDVTMRTGDGTIELAWRTPEGADRVVARRSLEPPRDATDGTLVKQTGPGNAKDEKLHNDRRYHYLICCGYRPDGKTEVFSQGVRIAAVPVAMPDPVQDFRATAVGQEVVCEWTPPPYGQVVLLRSAKAHDLPLGHRLTAEEMDRLGERIVTPAGGRAVDAKPQIGKPYYSLFTVAGAHSVVGGVRSAVVMPDVTNMKLLAAKEGVVLRWRWPEAPEVKSVEIVRRADAWPDGPGDPKATVFSCTVRQYEDAGERFVDSVQISRARFHYVVYSAVSGASGQWLSRGEDEGCRGVIQWAPRMTLRYRLEPGKGPKREELRLTWNVEQPFEDFSGFVLVANQTSVPTSLENGIALYSCTPAAGQASGNQEAWISLEPIRRSRWAFFYVKLLVKDPAQGCNTLVIHPDVSVPIADTGAFFTPDLSANVRTFQATVPRTVICPYCFLEFPLEEMLFTSYSGGDNVRTRYTWLDRTLKRPLRAPTNAQGHRLTRRLCPEGHELPYTAGDQSSLVIGIIGGKFAGKSSYIASLIERLQSRVCGDFQAALLPVSGEGQKRYEEEFFKPQFVNKREIGVTVGSPPPLMYELTMDGKLFGEKSNRAVTLALYDTAGENLKNPDEVRRTVQYLKVASGIMFLIDPLQVPAVREQVPASVRLPNQDQAALPHNIISNIMTELQAANAVAEDGRLSVPVAVVLTKCDVLRDAGLIDPNRLWREETRHVAQFDREIHNDTAGMMGEYVQRWSEPAYRIIRQKFSRFAFFGVSATGCASDGDTGRYRFVSPWRVEDPVLWLLAELGVIRKGGN